MLDQVTKMCVTEYGRIKERAYCIAVKSIAGMYSAIWTIAANAAVNAKWTSVAVTVTASMYCTIQNTVESAMGNALAVKGVSMDIVAMLDLYFSSYSLINLLNIYSLQLIFFKRKNIIWFIRGYIWVYTYLTYSSCRQILNFSLLDLSYLWKIKILDSNQDKPSFFFFFCYEEFYFLAEKNLWFVL